MLVALHTLVVYQILIKNASLNTILKCIVFAGFEVLTAVVMKSTIFWNITPCSPLKVNRRYIGTYRLHLQGRKIIRASRWRAKPPVT
jgi:hypothetical protein